MIQHWDDFKAAEVRLTPEDRAVLEARVRASTSEQRDVFRADHLVGCGMAFDAVDCPDCRYHASDGQPVAWPV